MANVIAFPKLHTEAEAAAKLGVSTDTLMRARQSGRLPYRRLGNGVGRIRYTDADLLTWLDRCGENQCLNDSDNSATSGSANDQTAASGAEHGSIPPPARPAVHRSAQTILNRRSTPSLSGSWRTAPSETSGPNTRTSRP